MGILKWLLEDVFGIRQNKSTTYPTDRISKISKPVSIIKKDMYDNTSDNMSDEKNEKKIEEEYIREREKRIKEWPSVKDELMNRYQVPIDDIAKPIAEQLYKKTDSLSAFFITDERVVRQRFIEGGEKAIEDYADNLKRHAFVGSPVTETFLRRLSILDKEKKDGNVIDTEIDIDGFTPNAKIEYSLKEIDIDGQKIPARKKFSPRCEMTATLTEGFHVGPFVVYDELYFCTKEEMEQMTSGGNKMQGMGMKNMEKMESGKLQESKSMEMKGSKMEKMDEETKLCPHKSSKDSYCSECNGDIVVSPSRKKVIGICLDVTGSMEGNKLNMARIAVEKVLDDIPVSDNIDVVLTIFSSDIRNKHEDIIPYGTKFTQDIKKMAISKVISLKAGGGTPLYEVINNFMDEIWSKGSIDIEKIYFPYTYLIVVSDGEDNQSNLDNIIYEGKKEKDAFFAKLKAYRNAGIITEIIPFAYGEGISIQLIKDLKNISGKMLINETDPDHITDAITSTVDSILYGADDLKMMGIPVSGMKSSMDTDMKSGMGSGMKSRSSDMKSMENM